MDGEFDSFMKAKYLFDCLMNKKGTKQMTLTGFGKIGKIKVLQSKIQRT